MFERFRKDPLLWRFSLYGFLKNQQYYEPFFFLVLQGKGLSFFRIGLLFSFREICVNVMGIPAGFLADLYGRRRALVLCFGAYILAFLGFALTQGLPCLFLSMFAFAVGESFRSGTHKAMIFHHLRLTGREAEKAIVYGITRSWSKTGSAVSSLLSGMLVFFTGNFGQIFLWAIPPYLLDMINVGTYPRRLEGEFTGSRPAFSLRANLGTMARETFRCLRNPELRGLFIQSAAIQTAAKTVKDYLQPLVVVSFAGLAIAGRLTTSLDATRRSACLLGLLYFGLNFLAALASRNANRFMRLERGRVPYLWIAVALVGGLIALGSALRAKMAGAIGIAVLGFVLLTLLENVWRPLFMDRLDDVSDSSYGSAVLSVEAQFQSLGIMVCAPLVGKMADRWGLPGVGFFVIALASVVGSHAVLGSKRSKMPEAP